MEAPGRRAAPERVRLEVDGSAGPWFHLRRVAACELAGLARRAGLGLVHAWVAGGRWFARLDAPPNRPPGGRAGP
ncbi:MAG: hypothetical protein M5U14_00310 [Acidimicrobiia bacterium]|nr:hypothetical protein [Acidimicrobiia bacterium]